MPLNSFNPRLWFVIGLGTVLYLFMLLLLSMRKEPVTLKLQGGNTQFVSPKLDPTSSFYKPQLPMPDIEENVYELFSSMRHPDFIQPYQSANGKTFSHHNEIWTEPLGKDLLIVDIDTRYSAKIFAEDQSVDWETNEELVVDAVFNHYLFAKIHGYSYHYYKPLPVAGHHSTWPKVHSLANLLPKYKFVVFLDADATFRHLGLPLEWLFNRWSITPRTSFAMARDLWDEDQNLCDSHGVPMVNTGFVIAQNLELTHRTFETWMRCTSGELGQGEWTGGYWANAEGESRGNDGYRKSYRECGQWKMKWAHEQSVFSEYLRRDFNPEGDNIVEIPCGEANGFPGHVWYDQVNCTGEFVRHHTFNKRLTKTTIADALAQAMMEVVKMQLGRNVDEVVIEEKEKEELKGMKDFGMGRVMEEMEFEDF